MAMKQVCVLLLFLPVFVLAAEKGSRCKTPNGESASCIGVTSCKVITDAVSTKNISAVEFARASQCGYDREPLVCCGTIGYKSPRGSTCTTPDGERASCRPLSTCTVVSDRIKSKEKSAIEYAKNSQCGFDNERLVCCGSQPTASIASSFFPNRTACGVTKSEDKVYGGQATEIDEHPWMVLLRYRYYDGKDAGFKCGGTLINKRYVLTAAHCVIINSNAGFDLDSVRLGEWRISTEDDCNEGLANEECTDPVVDLKVEKEIVHQGYSRRKGKNDIAILRLERNVAITDYVRPICMPPPESTEPEVGTELTVAGWGQTENSSYSDVKLRVELPLLDRSVCRARIRQRDPANEDQLCAGGERGKDSCLGDSGGPLMGKFTKADVLSKTQWYQEGIVSFGVLCGVDGFPAIYTRVSRYINWMKENMASF